MTRILIIRRQRIQPMHDRHDRTFSLELGFNKPLDKRLGGIVQTGGCLVHDQDLRLFEKGPRQGGLLLLSARKAIPLASHFIIQTGVYDLIIQMFFFQKVGDLCHEICRGRRVFRLEVTVDEIFKNTMGKHVFRSAMQGKSLLLGLLQPCLVQYVPGVCCRR